MGVLSFFVLSLSSDYIWSRLIGEILIILNRPTIYNSKNYQNFNANRKKKTY